MFLGILLGILSEVFQCISPIALNLWKVHF